MWPPAGKIAGEGHRLARAAGEQVSSHRSMTSQPSVAASSRPRPGALGSLVGQKAVMAVTGVRSEEHTSELQSRLHLVCRLLLEKKKITYNYPPFSVQPSTKQTRHRPTRA